MKQKLKTIGIILLSMIGMIILFIGVVGIGNYFQSIGQKIIGNLFMILFPILTYLSVKTFNKKINNLNSSSYGFHFKNFGKNILLGIGLAILIVAFGLVISNLFFGIPIRFATLKDGFEKPLLGLITSLLIIGVWEEFYFRGLVFNILLKNNFGFHLSALISAILFSIIHWSSFDMSETSWLWYIGIVFIGYILVYLYTITNSIWSVVSFHFIWNFLATLLDDKENELGLVEIPNYVEYSKMLDNIIVITLGILLIFIIFIARRSAILEKIKTYRIQITTANIV